MVRNSVMMLVAVLTRAFAVARQIFPRQATLCVGAFLRINRKILEKAKDVPEEKYDFRLKLEMRSSRELIVHVAGCNVYASKAWRGENVAWDDNLELRPKMHQSKAEVVARFEKTADDAHAALATMSNNAFAKTVDSWADVTQHSAEYYGLLVA